MANKPVVIRKRLAPSVPLHLELKDEKGGVEILSLRLSFDFNALALVEERTGISLLNGHIFKGMNATNLSLLLWASMQQNQPEYAGDDGLEVVRSYLSLENAGVAEAAITEAYMLCLPPEQRERIQKAVEEAAKKAAAGEPPAGEPSPLEPTPAQ